VFFFFFFVDTVILSAGAVVENEMARKCKKTINAARNS